MAKKRPRGEQGGDGGGGAEEDAAAVMRVVLPGDEVVADTAEAAAASERSIRAGPGLVRRGEAIVASRAGLVSDRVAASGKTRRLEVVEANAKRYLAVAEDLVVGTVTERHGEHYTVDVRGSRRATLPTLAFEGATKRNKPNLVVGAVVYARVAVANRDMDPELSCVSPGARSRKDWVTGETVFGELKGGYVFECSLALARELLDERCYVLRCLGRHLPFELAIGANGRVWVNSESPRHTVVVVNCILNSEGMSRSRTKAMVSKLVGVVA